MSVTIEITDTPDEAALARVETELAAFNDADVGPSEKATLAILVRDERGAVVAGISGYTAWGWLYVQKLWVDESLRGQGMAGRMLTAAEEEAERRGCHGAYIDTFNPGAEKAYTRQGYKEFGRMDDFPKGRSRIFLQKRLGPAASD
ncbi:GNAT family N-acetyltransferase [Nitratireductor rhodophyticola]